MFLTIMDPRCEIPALPRSGLSPGEFARPRNAKAQLPNEPIAVLRQREPNPEGFIRSAVNWLLKRLRDLFGLTENSQVDRATREQEEFKRFLRNRRRAAWYRS